jgi:hypothetical protein
MFSPRITLSRRRAKTGRGLLRQGREIGPRFAFSETPGETVDRFDHLRVGDVAGGGDEGGLRAVMAVHERKHIPAAQTF